MSDCSFSFNLDETGLFIDGKDGYSVSELFGFLSVGGAGRILGEKRRSVFLQNKKWRFDKIQ